MVRSVTTRGAATNCVPVDWNTLNVVLTFIVLFISATVSSSVGNLYISTPFLVSSSIICEEIEQANIVTAIQVVVVQFEDSYQRSEGKLRLLVFSCLV